MNMKIASQEDLIIKSFGDIEGNSSKSDLGKHIPLKKKKQTETVKLKKRHATVKRLNENPRIQEMKKDQ